MPPRVALIAALPREIAPLVARFEKKSGIHSPNGHPLYERGSVWLVCSGIGARHAAQTARWLVAEMQPELIVSVGFAGALTPQLKAGDVLVPGRVMDEGSGEVFECSTGQYSSGQCSSGQRSAEETVLLSGAAVLSGPAKHAAAAKYQAHLVDMEAAAVARVARQQGTRFVAVKAISDEVDFFLPPMGRFIDAHGDFETVKLLAYAVWHPRLWPMLARLGRNTKLASSQLCRLLNDQMTRDFEGVMQTAAEGQGPNRARTGALR